MFVGSVLIVVGVIALAVNLGLITGSIWSYVWPAVLILLGLSFLTRRHRRSYWFWEPWREEPGGKDKG